MTAIDHTAGVLLVFRGERAHDRQRGDGHVPGSRGVHPAGRRAPAGRSGHGTGGKPVNGPEITETALGAVTFLSLTSILCAREAIKRGWVRFSLSLAVVALEKRGTVPRRSPWPRPSPEPRSSRGVPHEPRRTAPAPRARSGRSSQPSPSPSRHG